MICSYGCKQVARYFFKNGKCCCEEVVAKCPFIKKNISEKLKYRISPNKGVIFSKERRIAISEGHKGLTPWNKGKRVLNLHRIKIRYPFFYQIEEPIEKDGQIYVKCKFCKQYFIPSNNQLSERIRVLEKTRDNSEQHFYCSDECKQKCPIYHSKPIFINKKNYPAESQLKIYRKKVLERDNYICVYCGREADRVHHIFPIKNCPEFSLDIDYGLSVCFDCHNIYAHKDDCSYNNIAYRRK